MRRSSLAVAVLLALAAVPIFSPQEARGAPADSSAIAAPELVPAPSLATVENVAGFGGTGVAQGAAATAMVSALAPDVATAAADVGSRFLAWANSDWGFALVIASILIGLALRAGPSDLHRSTRGQGAHLRSSDRKPAGLASASG